MGAFSQARIISGVGCRDYILGEMPVSRKRRLRRAPDATLTDRIPRLPQVPAWAIYATFALVSILFFVSKGLLSKPSRVGDGYEYMCMADNWAHHGTPWFDQATIRSCVVQVDGRRDITIFSVLNSGRTDTNHFWLLSLLAAPFVWVAHLFGLSVHYAFPLLHLALWLFVLWKMLRVLGWARAACCVGILASSPLVFYIDKAHAEFFVCGGLLLAVMAVYGNRLIEAAAWLGIVSNQQTAMAVFAAGLVAVWFWRERAWRSVSPKWLRAIAALLTAAPAPLYYLWRYHTPSLLGRLGYVDMKLISAHRAMSLYVDPDIGLFANWPLCLPLIAGTLAIAIFLRRKLTNLELLGGLSAFYLIVLPFLTSAQVNWNSGATIHMSRYALYFIPVISFCFVIAAFRLGRYLLPGRQHPAVYLTITLLAGLTIRPCYSWNMARFMPTNQGVYLSHTAIASWVYAHHPQWYDPVPEVFLERSTGTEDPYPQFHAGTWAVGDLFCRKLLLVRTSAELAGMKEFDRPLGCGVPFDSKEIVGQILAGEKKPSASGFMNLPDETRIPNP
jgi:hypothetical protein